ncbi:MAG: PhnD/SsuA/transferrin family substrate-binding protein [Gammaproteobacteria bacterium]|jgi:phosphonate transport system substrate-binding protein
MSKPIFLVVWLICCVLVTPVARGEEQPLTFGVFPYVSPGRLVAHQHGLAQFLASRLHRRVVMVTAPNYRTFFERTRRGDYDLALTAPHFARAAELHDGYRPLAITEHHISGVFIVRRDGPIHQIKDLSGRTVTDTVPETIVYQLALQTLAQHGLVPGRNVTILSTKTFNNAIFAALRGDSDAAVTGFKLWQHLAPRYKSQLRAIGQTRSIPGFVLIANPKLATATATAAQQAALAFAGSPAGKHYLFIGFKRVTEQTMKDFDPYTKFLKGWQ